MKILFNLLTTIEIPNADNFPPKEETEKMLTEFFAREGMIAYGLEVTDYYCNSNNKCVDCLDDVSSAQPEERTDKRTESHGVCDLISRKTGVWLAYTSVPGYMFCKCAACGADILVPYTGRNKPIFNYCPNCGAKMKGEMI